MIKRPSYKDLLLLIGILVAVLVTVTTLMRKETVSEANTHAPLPKKTSVLSTPSQLFMRLVEKVVSVPASHKASSSR